MTNVIAIDEGRMRRERRRQADPGSPLVWGMLGRSILDLTSVEDKERMAREVKSAKLRAQLVSAITELAVHDSPRAMIEFALPRIEAYRTGSCSNE